MTLKVFVIRDSKAEAFLVPFFQKSHGEAERSFTELTKDDKSMVSRYPEDYHLYYLGTYDDQTGVIDALEAPQHVVAATAVASRQRANMAFKEQPTLVNN